MFVRFRKIPCGGFRPSSASDDGAFIACQHPTPSGSCRYFHCHAKPRCRWLIGHDEQLVPYRLKVMLVENRRVEGKVKQETIAVLGSIEATWLPEFWDGINKKAATKLKTKDWLLHSLYERVAFWKIANQRLARLSNRLGPDLKRMRLAAHARVPWPKEPERKLLELLVAKKVFEDTQYYFRMHENIIERARKEIERQKETIEKSREANATLSVISAKESKRVMDLREQGKWLKTEASRHEVRTGASLENR